MSTLAFITLVALMVNTLSVPSPWSCDDIDHEMECQDILMDKYSLTVDDFYVCLYMTTNEWSPIPLNWQNMMPLHQAIMLDGMHPIYLPDAHQIEPHDMSPSMIDSLVILS